MRAVLFLAALMLTGCGGASDPPADASGFINETSATDAQLAALWKGAQQQLATQPIPLDPVTNPNNITYAPPNPKALQVEPDGLIVKYGPPPYAPDGAFACSESPTGYCWGITISSHEIEIAPKMILSAGATGWEMQDVILIRLGYNVGGR